MHRFAGFGAVSAMRVTNEIFILLSCFAMIRRVASDLFQGSCSHGQA
jgi:hypothetical protein